MTIDRAANSPSSSPTRGRRTPAILFAATALGAALNPAAATAQSGTTQPATMPDRPAWVVGDVPDTVWILVEAAVASEDESTMKALLKDAEGLARAAVVGHEDNIGRRFALAAALGMRADREGGRTKVRAASAMHHELLVVLQLDPGHAPARYMLGRLHAGVRRMNGVTRWLATNVMGGATLKQATWELAEENLAYAERAMPDVPDHHLQLARLYMDTGRPDDASREVDHVLSLRVESPLELEAVAEARTLRAELDRL